MELNLLEKIKSVTAINYKENHNYETRLWSSGYMKAMSDIKNILNSYEIENNDKNKNEI